MALWRRFGNAGYESLIYRFKRWYSVLPGGRAQSTDGVVRLQGFRVLEERFPGDGPIVCCTHFRYYVATGQVKPKTKIEGKGGDWRNPKVENDLRIRINEAIKEREVRLVTDEGHNVVSIQEALYLARKLDLDLVEVQRKVKVEGGAKSTVFKPAVCKLMDYCKEKYKQDLKEKERAKGKSAITLRNGENKEVRFKAKTELKDLKIKAESVKRLMERGYRVKCTAMPTGKGDEDLGGLLLNLLSLIEDISAVESGPHLDTKNAYVIVKHIKFASKKGKKLSKALETVSSVLSTRSNTAADISASKDENDSQADEEWEAVESDSETEVADSSKQVKTKTQNLSGLLPTSITLNTNLTSSSKTMSASEAPVFHPSQPEPHVTETNRYSKGSNPTIHQIRPTNREQRIPDRRSGREFEDRGRSNPNDRPGGFSASQSSGPIDRRGVPMGNPNAPNVPQQRYGAFSPAKSSPPVDERRVREISGDRVSKSDSSKSSYGIFSAPKTSSSDDLMKQRDETRDDSSNSSFPSPRFGIFTSSKKASSGDGRVGDKN